VAGRSRGSSTCAASGAASILACVVVAGTYGAMTVNRRIFFVQALPALLAIGALLLR